MTDRAKTSVFEEDRQKNLNELYEQGTDKEDSDICRYRPAVFRDCIQLCAAGA
jgi:hypothetical protein